MWWFANTMISFEEEVSMDMSLPNISRVWPCCIRTPSANVAKGRGSQWWTSPRDRRTWPQRPSLAAAINGESLGIAMDATLLIWDSSKSDASTSMKCGTANYEYQSVPACRSAKEIILIVFFKISSGGTCICKAWANPSAPRLFGTSCHFWSFASPSQHKGNNVHQWANASQAVPWLPCGSVERIQWNSKHPKPFGRAVGNHWSDATQLGYEHNILIADPFWTNDALILYTNTGHNRNPWKPPAVRMMKMCKPHHTLVCLQCCTQKCDKHQKKYTKNIKKCTETTGPTMFITEAFSRAKWPKSLFPRPLPL